MSVMAGMEDLKPAKVLGWQNGMLIAMCDGDPTEYEVFIYPGGTVKAKKFVPDTTHDQTPLTQKQRQEQATKRWEGIDQV